MGTRIDHRVGGVIVRQVRVIGMPVESELEHPRPGQVELVAQGDTSGVISPKSSAMNGRPPSSLCAALKNSAPGPGTHWPDCAVGAPAGTCQAAANPRKWSRRITST